MRAFRQPKADQQQEATSLVRIMRTQPASHHQIVLSTSKDQHAGKASLPPFIIIAPKHMFLTRLTCSRRAAGTVPQPLLIDTLVTT